MTAEPAQPQDTHLDLGEVLDGRAVDGAYDEFEPQNRPLVDDLGRVRLSFSRIDTHEQCGLKFRFRYVDKLPTEGRSYLSFGTSVHAALEAFHERTLFGMPDEAELLGFLYDGWESAGFQSLPRETQVSQYRRAQDALRRYHQRVSPTYRPAAETEAWFELPVKDRALVVGSIDRLDVDDDGDYHVIDYKTGKLKSVRHVRESLQLAIYALACEHLYGRLPKTVSLDFVMAGTAVVVDVVDIDLEDARRRILRAADAVLAEQFPAMPNRLCDWCDFRDACPAWIGEGPDLLGPATVRIDELRRRVAREVAELRQLEAILPSLTASVDDAISTAEPADPTATVSDSTDDGEP